MTGRKGGKVRGRWTDGRGRRGYGGHAAGESAATIALAFAFPIESPPRMWDSPIADTFCLAWATAPNSASLIMTIVNLHLVITVVSFEEFYLHQQFQA